MRCESVRTDRWHALALILLVALAPRVGHAADILLDEPVRLKNVICFPSRADGVQLADFGDALSSVVVQLRKQHESGAETLDEVKIDRVGFARRGSDYKLLYGWKGDDDRSRWFEYDYRVRWSFPGAAPLESEWRPGTFGVIDLAPPYRRRVIEIDGDAEAVRDREVRSITVRIYYSLGGTERIKQISLRASEGDLSSRIEILSGQDAAAYDYEITWRLKGNRTLTSGRLSTTADVLYVDELPSAPVDAP